MTGKFSIPATDEALAGQKAAALLADVYVPHDAAAGLHRGHLTLSAGGQQLILDIALHVWDFTLPDYLSFIPEMNCYSLPAEPGKPLATAYYRLAHAHRTNLNRLGYNWRGQVNDGCGPGWNGREFQWEAWDKRFGPLLDGSAFADLPRRSRAGRCVLSAAQRELADGRVQELSRRLLGRAAPFRLSTGPCWCRPARLCPPPARKGI